MESGQQDCGEKKDQSIASDAAQPKNHRGKGEQPEIDEPWVSGAVHKKSKKPKATPKTDTVEKDNIEVIIPPGEYMCQRQWLGDHPELQV